MDSAARFLPAPVRSYEVFTEEQAASSKPAPRSLPPYGKRQGFIPRSQEDFGDGGAYPEIHVAQYPLDMGRPGKSSTDIVPIGVDASTGAARFDALVARPDRKVHSQFSALAEKSTDIIAARPSDEEAKAAAARTQAALEGVLAKRAPTSGLAAVASQSTARADQSTFIRYTASADVPGYSEATAERIVRMVEAPIDPMEPSRFKHKKVPTVKSGEAVPVMHSPPRKLTAEDTEAWKIPTALSNYTNKRGYIIPLDQRVAADGRSLQEPTINDNFARFSEALLIAERQARQDVEMRAAVAKKLAIMEKEDKERQLREMAQQARNVRTGVTSSSGFTATDAARAASAVLPQANRSLVEEYDDDGDAVDPRAPSSVRVDAPVRAAPPTDFEGVHAEPPPRPRGEDETDEDYQARLQRDRMRVERKRQREAELRVEASGRRKMPRDADRDVSERVALGMSAAGGAMTSGEGMYDTRLFNQSEGLSSGFGGDDDYNVYSKAWRESMQTHIYRPRNATGGVMDAAAAEAAVQSLRDNQRFDSEKDADFEGVSARGGGRPGKPAAASSSTGPVQFERSSDPDPFGLDAMLSSTRSGAPTGPRTSALDGIGRSGGMRAAAGSALTGEEAALRGAEGFSRDRINFRAAQK